MTLAAFKAVVSFARGTGRFDSYALPPVSGGDSGNPQTCAQISANNPQSPYENASSTAGGQDATVKVPVGFSEASEAQKQAHSKHFAVALPADLAELAGLWERLPEALRQSWLLAAREVAKGRA